MAPIKCGYLPSAEIVDIPTQYFTHLIYAFLNPDRTFQFNIDDVKAAQLKTFTATLHAKSPPVKVLFAVGGGGDSIAASFLSLMASEPTSRDQFIKWSISVARGLGFDGIDLDWEYPQNPKEMENLGKLLKEWREAVKEEADSTGQTALLLTAAVYYLTTISGPLCVIRSYPVSTMSANLDFINVMTYDFYGSSEPITCAFAPLYGPKSTDAGINSWTTAGAPSEKLIMGLPFCGRMWWLLDPTETGIGAPAKANGVITYAEVVHFNEANNARVEHVEATVSVYSVAGQNWISYDDPWSVAGRDICTKVKYAKEHGLGGHFCWQVTGDYKWTLSKAGSVSWPS